jgi:hypothetical protein
MGGLCSSAKRVRLRQPDHTDSSIAKNDLGDPLFRRHAVRAFGHKFMKRSRSGISLFNGIVLEWSGRIAFDCHWEPVNRKCSGSFPISVGMNYRPCGKSFMRGKVHIASSTYEHELLAYSRLKSSGQLNREFSEGAENRETLGDDNNLPCEVIKLNRNQARGRLIDQGRNARPGLRADIDDAHSQRTE